MAGAVGAGVVSYEGARLNSLSQSLPKGLGSVISTAAAVGIGYAAGGSEGAASAFNTDANNRQLHPDEIKWIRDNAHAFAEQNGISDADAQKRLAQQALKDVDLIWRASLPSGEDRAAQTFLGKASQTFANDAGEQQQYFTTTHGQFLMLINFAGASAY